MRKAGPVGGPPLPSQARLKYHGSMSGPGYQRADGPQPSRLPLRDLEEVAAAAAGAFKALRGARLFVTGGTGFFGRWLLETLAFAAWKERLEVMATVLTRDPGRARARFAHLLEPPRFSFVAGDVRTFSWPGRSFTHVIHAAAPSSTAGRPASRTETLGVVDRGTRRVLDFAAFAGVRRFLLTSSGAVYGRQPPDVDRVPEDALEPGRSVEPLTNDPKEIYGHAKRQAEMRCLRAMHGGGVRPVLARCFAFAGPHLPLDAHYAFGNFIGDGLAGRPIRIEGDGTPLRSYLYAGDLAVWLWTMLAFGEAGRAYNVGSEEAVGIGELAERVGARLGVAVERTRTPVPGQPVERYVPSTERAREELGLKVTVGLGEAIDRTVRWHRGEP